MKLVVEIKTIQSFFYIFPHSPQISFLFPALNDIISTVLCVHINTVRTQKQELGVKVEQDIN